MGRFDRYLHNRTTVTRRYETAIIQEKTSLEEFLVDPVAWFRMLVVAFFAPSTLFSSVKYGGGIVLPLALFLLLNGFYSTAILNSGGMHFYSAAWGGAYVALTGVLIWAFISGWLHLIRKKMHVHPRFGHFLRFAVWNQLIMFWPMVIAYTASFVWPTGDLILALLVCFSFGYSVFGFIQVFKPRSLVAPMTIVICALSIFSTLSIVVGIRGVDGEHNQYSAWMDPKIAVPRLEYHYHNQKRVMVAEYKKWKDPSYQEPQRPSLASHLD